VEDSGVDPHLDLLGRENEVARVRELVDGLPAAGSCLLIVGAAGLGKTALLDRAAGFAAANGARVVAAAGVEFEAELPYAGLHLVLQSLLPELDDFPAEQRHPLLVALGLGQGEAPSAVGLGSAVLSLLDRASREQSLVLLLDDIHWIDRSSATVLSFVARRLSSTAVGLVVTSRVSDSYFDSSGMPQLALAPLDENSAAALIERHHATLSTRDRMQVLHDAQGNPLALLELPGALRANRSGPAEAHLLPVTRRLQAMYDGRIEGLTSAARHLLLLAALEGTGNLAALPASDARAHALAEVEDAELAFLDARLRFTFRHPLVRSVVVHHASAAERRAAHAELAAALGEDPDREAWHLSQAATAPDEGVSSRLEQTARRALRRGDGVTAVRTLLRSADLSPDLGVRARRLAQAAYVGADVTGDLSSVSELLDEARKHDPSPHQSLQAASATAYALLNGDGDAETAYRMLTQSLEVNIDHIVDEDALDEALLILLSVCLWTLNTDFFATFTALTDRLGQGVRDDLRLEAALIADPVRTALPVLPQLDTAIVQLVQETDLVQIERMARAGTYVDRVPACREALWRVVRSGRSGGAIATGVNALMHLSIDDYRSGDWDEAVRLAEEGLALCAQHGYSLPSWAFRLTRGLVAAGRGEYELGAELADMCSHWATPREMHGVRIFGAHIQAALALSAADWNGAASHLTQICPPGQLPELMAYALWTPLDLVEALVRAGRTGDARIHVEVMQSAGIEAISTRQQFLSRCCHVWIASETDVSSAYDEMIASSEGGRWPFEMARMELGYGERLRRSRATSASRPHLERSLHIFRGLDARPWAARAASELRAAGRTVRPVVAGTGPSTLTAQEFQIASMAGTGMTNKQIGAKLNLSHRTIGAHLRSVFAKLGVTSRVSLSRALDELVE
jgi:DNA-binding CsgD family transcriptional regulator